MPSHTAYFAFILALISWAIGSIIWAVRLEGRVNLVEKILETTAIQHQTMFNRILSQLERIESNMVSIKVTCAAFNHSTKGLNGKSDEVA